MSSPVWKVYSPDGEYIGCVKDAEDAAALVYLRGEGGTVRYDHKHIVWREGVEEQSAGDSYDFAAGVMHKRIAEVHERSMARLRGRQEAFARSRGLEP